MRYCIRALQAAVLICVPIAVSAAIPRITWPSEYTAVFSAEIVFLKDSPQKTPAEVAATLEATVKALQSKGTTVDAAYRKQLEDTIKLGNTAVRRHNRFFHFARLADLGFVWMLSDSPDNFLFQKQPDGSLNNDGLLNSQIVSKQGLYVILDSGTAEAFGDFRQAEINVWGDLPTRAMDLRTLAYFDAELMGAGYEVVEQGANTVFTSRHGKERFSLAYEDEPTPDGGRRLKARRDVPRETIELVLAKDGSPQQIDLESSRYGGYSLSAKLIPISFVPTVDRKIYVPAIPAEARVKNRLSPTRAVGRWGTDGWDNVERFAPVAASVPHSPPAIDSPKYGLLPYWLVRGWPWGLAAALVIVGIFYSRRRNARKP